MEQCQVKIEDISENGGINSGLFVERDYPSFKFVKCGGIGIHPNDQPDVFCQVKEETLSAEDDGDDIVVKKETNMEREWNAESLPTADTEMLQDRDRIHLRSPTGSVPTSSNCEVSVRNCSAVLTSNSESNNKAKEFRCNICNKSLAKRYYLEKHMRSHNGEKPFQCDICSKCFSQKSHLERHMLTHVGGKPFQCNICTQSFSRKDNMIVHMRTHSGERPYLCGICSMSFTSSRALKLHMVTHSGEKPFQCVTCDKSFSFKHHLKEHMFTHSEGKRFQCDICSKSFSRNGHLKQHMRSHNSKKFLM